MALLDVDSVNQTQVSHVFKHERLGNLSSVNILPLLNVLLSQANVAIKACVAIAVGTGPGSFTGLRTAVSIAQGLAFALAIPVISVNTLLACAQRAHFQYPECTRYLTVLDARMKQVYWVVCHWDAHVAQCLVSSEIQLTTIDEMKAPQAPFMYVGHGPIHFQREISMAKSAQWMDETALPDARFIAQIGLQKWLKGEVSAPEALLPEYVRNKVALTTIERQAKKGA